MGTTPTAVRPHPGAPERLATPAFVRLLVADLAYFTSAGVAFYALPVFVTGPVGSDEAGAGLAFGAFAISALLLRPVAGRLADTRGRRPLLVWGAVLCAVATALTAVVDTLPLVLVLRLVLGVSEAAFFVASLAVLADLAPPSRRGEALSYNSLGLYLGIALGPPIGELLTRTMGLAAAWYGAAGLALLATAVVAGIAETRAPRSDGAAPARLIHRAALGPALGFLAAVVPMGGFLAFATLHAEGVGLAATSLPLFAYGVVVVLGRITFAKVVDRLPPLLLAGAALATIAGGLGVVAAWAAPAGLLAGAALLAVGVTFATPAFFAAVFATAAPHERGVAAGTMSAALDVGLGGGPILLGVVAGAAGTGPAFGVAAVVAVLGCGWTLLLARA
jgi:predicted MFS family arabinose efflux permease